VVDAAKIANLVFGVSIQNLDGLAVIKSDTRGLGFNYSLKTPIEVDLERLSKFTFKLGKDTYTGKLFIPLGPPPLLGDEIIVTIQRTGFALTELQIYNWLKLYGSVVGEIRFKYHSELPSVKEDYMEVLMKLSKHIPSTLPAFGKKVFIKYRGQPIQCSKCFALGHTRRLCSSETLNWLGYVKSLLDANYIPPSFFGVWLEYLRSHEAVVSSEF